MIQLTLLTQGGDAFGLGSGCGEEVSAVSDCHGDGSWLCAQAFYDTRRRRLPLHERSDLNQVNVRPATE
jgi:hypothetical protein